MTIATSTSLTVSNGRIAAHVHHVKNPGDDQDRQCGQHDGAEPSDDAARDPDPRGRIEFLDQYRRNAKVLNSEPPSATMTAVTWMKSTNMRRISIVH